MRFQRLFGIVRYHRRLATRVFALTFGVIALAVFLLPGSYATSSEVLLHRPQPQVGNGDVEALRGLIDDDPRASNETFIALGMRDDVAERVCRELHLNVSSRNLMQRHVVMSPVTNADVLTINASWSDPRTSARIADAFAAAFIEGLRRVNAERADEAVAAAHRSMEQAQRGAAAAETALGSYQSEQHIADVQTQTTSLVTQYAALLAKIDDLTADSGQAQARLDADARQLAVMHPTVQGQESTASSAGRMELQVQLAQAESQLAATLKQFTDDYPTVAALKGQVESLRRRVAELPAQDVSRTLVANPVAQHLSEDAAVLTTQIAGDTAEIRELRIQHARLAGEVRDMSATQTIVGDLARRAKAAEDILAVVRNAYYQALVAQAVAPADASIVQKANADLAVRSPNMLLALSIAVVIAFLAALSSVVALSEINARKHKITAGESGSIRSSDDAFKEPATLF